VVPFRFRTRTLAVLAAACWLATAALAAGTQASPAAPDERTLLSDVPSVFTASKYDQPTSEAPADVSVVTRAEILRYGWLTIADVLRGVRSFLVTNDRNYSYAGVRGAVRTGDYNGRILLLVDGHRVNDTIYDQALLGTEGPVDLELVERIEIVRGAGSSVYGSNAFFGVINVITRRGREVGGVEAGAFGGSQQTYGGRITIGDRIGASSEYLLSATAGKTNGERTLQFPTFRDINDGMAVDQDADRWVKALAQWRIGDLSLSAVYDQRTRHVPTAPFNSVFNDARNETTDTRAWLEARYDTALAGGNLTARAAVDDYRYEGNLVQSIAPDIVNQDRSQATWWTAEATWSRDLADNLRLLLGAEAQSDIRNRQENGDRTFGGNDDLGYQRYFLATDSTRYWALYGQLEWQIARGLEAALGLRHDQYSSFGGVTDPRLALIYRPVDDLTLKLIYGQAFRAPNDYELYYNDGGVSQKANPGLQPERIRTSEALVEWRFAPQWRAVGAFYYNRITDLVTTVTDASDGLLVNVNSQSQIGRGLEAEIEGRTGFGLEMFGAATTQLGEVAVGAPRTQLKGRLAQSFLGERAIAALEAIYASSRQTLLGTTIPGQTLTNLVFTAQNFWPGLRLTAAVQNVFDATLADPGGPEHRQDRIPQPGREFWLKVDVAFP
jgi:outer membrane receptor for ferrienterochelin and colicins